MAISVYINFKGNCREAVEFYANIFGTETLKIMTFGDAPPNPEFTVTEDVKDLILNASLNVKGSIVMFSDVPPFMDLITGNNITLVINDNSIEQIKYIFDKLKEGGSVTMELQETFWSKCYGFVVDKFGIGWQLSYDNGENQF